MKHAFLLIAHNEPEVLACLLRCLDHPLHEVFLLTDRRAESLYRRFAHYRMERATLHVLPPDQDIRWGDLSLVRAECRLFRAAHDRGPFAYYHLLSGADLMLQSAEALHSFFEQHRGEEFVSVWDTPEHMRDALRRMRYHYFFTRHLRPRGTWRHRACAPLYNLVLLPQKIVRWQRRLPFAEVKKGSQWVSVTEAFCAYLLRQEEAVLRAWRHTLCGDEIFLQTVLWNSPFRARLSARGTIARETCRLIDWERGAPYVWRASDWAEMQASGCFFARKVTGADSGLLRLAEAHALKRDAGA